MEFADIGQFFKNILRVFQSAGYRRAYPAVNVPFTATGNADHQC
jgi:hypothetical protein